MLGVKDKGIILQIIKRCNRIIDKILKIVIEKFNNDEDLKGIIVKVY